MKVFGLQLICLHRKATTFNDVGTSIVMAKFGDKTLKQR